jgi:hypothetical protein
MLRGRIDNLYITEKRAIMLILLKKNEGVGSFYK